MSLLNKKGYIKEYLLQTVCKRLSSSEEIEKQTTLSAVEDLL